MICQFGHFSSEQVGKGRHTELRVNSRCPFRVWQASRAAYVARRARGVVPAIPGTTPRGYRVTTRRSVRATARRKDHEAVVEQVGPGGPVRAHPAPGAEERLQVGRDVVTGAGEPHHLEQGPG